MRAAAERRNEITPQPCAGTMAAKAHPNLLLWNVTRFHPFYALLEARRPLPPGRLDTRLPWEPAPGTGDDTTSDPPLRPGHPPPPRTPPQVLMGVVAVRLVMTETLDDEGKPTRARSPAGSALLPLLGIVGVTAGRALGWIQLNDPLTRGLVFIPLFLLLLVRLHKQTLQNQERPAGVTGLLSHPALAYLGAISFPIFIVHGALGQLFFKKARRGVSSDIRGDAVR